MLLIMIYSLEIKNWKLPMQWIDTNITGYITFTLWRRWRWSSTRWWHLFSQVRNNMNSTFADDEPTDRTTNARSVQLIQRHVYYSTLAHFLFTLKLSSTVSSSLSDISDISGDAWKIFISILQKINK